MYVKAFSPSILGKNHVAYMDNKDILPAYLSLKIYSCGTLPPKPTNWSHRDCKKIFLKTMNRGDYSTQSKNNIVATVLKDKKHIFLMSNAYILHLLMIK